METIRAFIALHIPALIKSAISTLQNDLNAHPFPIKWVRPENMHLTLRFLGNIPADPQADIHHQMTLAATDIEPFTLTLKGVGAFPDTRQPRVVITELGHGSPSLIDLKSSLDSHLEPLGFEKETQSFKGHLTLGRVKGSIDSRRFRDAIAPVAEFETKPFTVDRILLYRSDLKPFGPVYTKLSEARFGTAGT